MPQAPRHLRRREARGLANLSRPVVDMHLASQLAVQVRQHFLERLHPVRFFVLPLLTQPLNQAGFIGSVQIELRSD